MAVTIVGVNAANTTGAVNITIPLPAGVASGDNVVLWLKYKRAAGTSTSATTPSGWTWVGENSSGEGVSLFQKLYTTTPPANVVVTFSNSDTHCRAQSIAWRGGFDDGAGSTIRQVTFAQIAGVSGANTLPTQWTEYPNSVMLSLYATGGASITVPAAQTSLAASTQAGPPALGIASGSQLVLSAGSVAGGTVTLSVSATLVLARLTIIPADATNPFAPFWEATPLGPYPGFGSTGYVVFDTTGDYAYYVGQDDYVSTGIVTIRKIQRSTFTVVATATLTGHRTHQPRLIAQDATALYIGHALSESPNESYFKILKSDLSLVYSGAHATDTTLVHNLRLGKTGTWSAGLLFSVMWSATTSVKYLVAWDSATGAVSSRTTIPHVAIDPGPAPNPSFQEGEDQLQVDNNGDLWLYSARSSFTGATLALTKITSGPTFGTPVSISTVYARDDPSAGLIYDPATHALIITSNLGSSFARPGVLVRYDLATATVTYQATYPTGLDRTTATLGGLTLMQQDGNMVEGNSLRDFQGVPSIFIGRCAFNALTGVFERHCRITHYNHLTGELIRVLEMQPISGLASTYGPVVNVMQSPENDLWMVSVERLSSIAFNEYVHKLNLAGGISAASSQGYVSWAEMQVPTANPTITFHRPAYGRGYGLGYGGAGPVTIANPDPEAQIARPSVDTFLGDYTDAAAGIINIYQSIDEAIANDVDYVRSRLSPTNDPYVVKLSTLIDPTVDTGHIIRYRYAVKPGSAEQLDLYVQLRRLYVDESDQGLLIKQWIHALVSTTFTLAEQTLVEAEADDIIPVQYDSLFLRFVFTIAGTPIP